MPIHGLRASGRLTRGASVADDDHHEFSRPGERPISSLSLSMLLFVIGCAVDLPPPRSVTQRSTAEGAGATSALALGASHGCVLRSLGDVICWGDNSFRQSAPAATNLSATIPSIFASAPIYLGADPVMAVELAVGGNISCARRSLGDIVCWGNNTSGTVNGTPGTPGVASSNTIVLGSATRQAKGIAVGTDHLCAVLDTGEIVCRGDSSGNRLGAAPSSAGAWVQVPGLTLATKVVAGDRHTCALRANGLVLCWGEYAGTSVGFAPTVVDADVLDIVAGDRHTCTLHADHSVRCWGSNASGQFGAGASAPSASATPVLTTALSGEFALSLAAGGAHTCAIFSDDTTRCWGSNGAGQSGLPFSTISTNVVGSPVQSGVGSTMRDATFVEAGGSFTCVTGRNVGSLDDGIVRCWGGNTRNQLGSPSYPAGTNSEIAVGSFTPDSTCGTYFSAWTSPHAGPLLDSGARHVCMFLESAVCPSGAYSRGVHCFGSNSEGQLGNGTLSDSSTIVKVQGLPGNIRSLSAGGNHNCVVDGLGRVFCWGANSHGESGAPPATSGGTPPSYVATPVQVALEGGATARAVAVTCGADFSCALMASGEVQCWGSNVSGQLGRVVPWLHSTDMMVPLGAGWNESFNATGQRVRCGSCTNAVYLNRVTQISAGTAAVCARLVSGEIRCWGRNPRANGGTTRTAANEDTRIFGCGGDPRFCGCMNGAADYCAPGAGPVPNDQISLNVLPHAGRLNANFVSHVDGTYLPPGCGDSSSLDPIVAVSVHDDGGCIVLADGHVFCWGSAGNGRRGDDTTTGMTQLIQAVRPFVADDGFQDNVTNIVAINGGDTTTCALRTDGRALCWGGNSLRQTSGTAMGDRQRAVRVMISANGATLLKNAISVTAGGEQSCAMTEGWVRCWGARTGNTTFPSGPVASPITPL